MRRIVLFMLLVLGVVLPLSTQTDFSAMVGGGPLVFNNNSELYADSIDDTPFGSNISPFRHVSSMDAKPALGRLDTVVSPDGRWVVFADVPAFYAQAWNDNLTGNIGFFPADLWLTDMEGTQSYEIATHSADATFDNPASLRYRMQLGDKHVAFSPDSSQILYSESYGACTQGQPCTRLMLYDIEARETTELYVWDEQIGGGPLYWGEDAIYFRNYVISFDGELRRELIPNDGVLISRDIVIVDEKPYLTVAILGFPNPDGDFAYLMDFETGEYYYASAEISVVSATAPDSSLRLVGYDNDTRPNSVYAADGELVAVPSTEQAPFAFDYVISPDGTHYAYNLTELGVQIGDSDGNEREPELAAPGFYHLAAAWGASQYTLFSKQGPVELLPTLDPYAADVCGPLPDVGLVAGGQGRVLPGAPNNVRTHPTTEAAVIGSIPGEAVFDVVDGQQNVCVDGIRWAQVTYDGVTGWTAQSVGDEAFIEPVQ